jgi:thioredoxin 1
MVKELKSFSELEDLVMEISDEQLVVVDCFASWCGPCKKIAPFVEQLERKYPKVVFLKANVEKIRELSTEFKVTAMPTFIYLKGLTVVGKTTGADQTVIEKKVRELQ